MLLRKCCGIFLYLYLQIAVTSCEEGSTLAFAIDDTLSMSDDIFYVKEGAISIMNLVVSKKQNAIKDMVLVTFNDPDVRQRTNTSSKYVFLDHLNRIQPNNRYNRDCPEMSLTGMEIALESSRPESYVFVFTDANAKDYYKLDKIKSLCQKKQSQVVIVFSIALDCYSPHEKTFTVYYDVAQACSGQVFIVEKQQIKSVLKTIETLLQGKNSIFKWITVKRTASFYPVMFTIDEKAEYAIVSTSGKNVYLRVTSKNSSLSPELRYEKTMWNNNGKVVKLINPKPGTYYAWVKGESTISVVVYGRTDFTFGHGFSVRQPKSMTDTTKQPTADLNQYLSINVTDPDNSVNIKSVQILDIRYNDRITYELPLRIVAKDFYITEAFVPPNYTFRIAIKGELKKTHETIIRISRTNIDSIIIDVRPEIQPTNKNIQVIKGGKFELLCKIVGGKPAPQVKWFKKSGASYTPLSNMNSKVLEVNNAMFIHAGQYKCEAINRVGTDTATFDVTVSGLPEVSIIETKREVSYDGNIEFTCKVKSYPRPSIVWKNEVGAVFQSEMTMSSEYEFNSQLKLQNLRRSAVYNCLASNTVGFTTKDVKVTVLPSFEVKKHIDGVIGIKYGGNETLKCEIKSTKPMTIRWYKERSDIKSSRSVISPSNKYSISSDGTALTIRGMEIDMAGTYTCEASLVSIPTEKVAYSTKINIDGLIRPEIKLPNKNIRVMKRGRIELVCKIIRGYPKPPMKWFKKNGTNYTPLSNMNSEVLVVNNAMFMHAGQYKCEATNGVGTDSVIFDVTVSGLPEVSITQTKREVPYDGNIEFTCKVNSYPQPSIVWKYGRTVLQSEIIKSSEYEFNSLLKVKNLRKSAVFNCVASNTVGSTTENVTITVLPPFEVKKHIEGVIGIKYGGNETLKCEIKSTKPMTIRWYKERSDIKSSRSVISPSNKYSISSDGTALTIRGMEIDMAGTYTCEASLVSIPTEKVAYSTKINIDGLIRPEIKLPNKNIRVMKRGRIELVCKIIRGYPKPPMKWFKKNGTNYTPLSNMNSEVLVVNNAMFMHAGQYKCEATNGVGTDSVIFDVTVSGLPEVSITQTKREVPYDGNIEFTCKVKSYPQPSIVWKYGRNVLQSEMIKSSEYEFNSRLEVKNLRKSAVFNCVTSNTVGSTTENVTITVLPPFEVKKHIEGVIGIKYGGNETLECEVKSRKPMTIRWYKERSDIKSSRSVISPSNKYTISSDGTALTIKGMEIDMAGTYTCEAYLVSIPTEKVAYSTKINIDGLHGPEVTYYTSNLNGKNFKAVCRVKGVPTPVISWQFKPIGSTKFRTILGSQEELNIPELKTNGVYKCIGQNSLGKTEHDFTVTLEERPIIHSKESTFFGVVGDLVMKIPCNVTGFPVPTIVWKMDRQSLNMGSKYVIKGTSLYINNPVVSDSSEYTCEATNKLGSDTKNFVVIIADNLDVDDSEYENGVTSDTYAEERKTKTINCNLNKEGEVSIRWYLDGILTNRTGRTYTIRDVSTLDDGNYTCRMNTNEGSTSETYVLTVGNLPSFNIRTLSPLTVNWTDVDKDLDCTAESQLDVKYEWSHDGKVLESDSETKKTVTDWGEYTCNVSNALGSIQKTFNVITSGCFISKNIATQHKPLVSHRNTPTWPPNISNSHILLKENEEIKLSCLSNEISTNNFKGIPSKTELIAKCNTQDKFTVDGKIYRYSDLQCNNKVESTVVETREQCSGPNTEIIRVGFEVNGFLDAYKVCYDKRLNVPIYVRTSYQIASNKDIVNAQFDWSSAPELTNRTTGNWKQEGTCKCCYTRGQLVNVNEVAFGPAQDATFKDNLNSVPVWNPSCNDSHRLTWQTFDNDSRKIALAEKWSSWTGASEYVLKDGRLVPRYLWKVLTAEDGFITAMVYVNDRSPVANDVKCSSDCDAVTETDDFLYCCTLKEFSKNFGVPLNTF